MKTLDSAHETSGTGPDEDLVVAARRGERPALEQLLVRHHDRINALCRRLLCSDSDAEDATQDTLLAVVRSLSSFDGRSSFGTWIYRIATNQCLDELRRRRRRPLPTSLDSDGAGEAHVGAIAVAAGPAELAVARVDVDAALTKLSPEFRVAVVLRDLCDLSYEEIAEVLHVPVGTVRSRIARGRASLADLVGNFAGSANVEMVVGQDAAPQQAPELPRELPQELGR